MVRFSSICIDTPDLVVAAEVASFWAAALGGRVEQLDDGAFVVRRGGELPIWVDPVPEPKTVKNRFHPDLRAASVTSLIELGAVVIDEHEIHSVCADPAGNEFCVFPSIEAVPARTAPATMFALCIDSERPADSAQWWRDRIGGEIGPGPDGAPRYVHGGGGLGAMTLKFVPVADQPVVKNRWHWDVETSTLDELIAAGARVVRERDDEISWTVFNDPDGNVFCAFEPDQWV